MTSILLKISAANELHHEFHMIKYAREGRSIPHERVFKLDNDNLVCTCYRSILKAGQIKSKLGKFQIIGS